MKSYIKKSIANHFVTFAEPLKVEEYNNLGETWSDFLKNKWVPLSDEQVAFHNANPDADVQEVWNMVLNPLPERTLEGAKEEMLAKISSYDKSSFVNGFTINNSIDGWLYPDERSNYKSSIDAAKLLGLDTLKFYVGNMMITASTQEAERMLAQIQLYADACFIVTKQHKMTVEALSTIEEVDAFAYEDGYPAKLNFTVDENTVIATENVS